MNTTNNKFKLIAILIYTVIAGIALISLGSIETTITTSVITLILSFSIVVIYSISRDIFPKFMIILVAGANILTMIATLVEIAFIL
ncbi:hypothetical protein [Staphylococcus cohnii]|uniref:hypothetical protein n=1 Tax=Staphylococcus cohnii TaxID=29382 RepID=UPI003ABF2458